MTQTLTAPMITALRMRSSTSLATIGRQPVVLFEVYEHDYYPSSGFNPADAIELFSEVGVTWPGNHYRRQIKSHGDISRFITSQFNQSTLSFDNTDLFMSQFVIANQVEGMRLVVRYIDRVASTTLADSLVLFTGRFEKPSSLNEEDCSAGAKQDLGSINYEIPRRTFSRVDPLGRSPNDPLFEGFRFTPNFGVSYYTETVSKRFLFFFSRNKQEKRSKQWSSEDNIHEGQAIPLIFGRCQMEGIPVVWQDEGNEVIGLYVFAGHKITSMTDIQNHTPGFRFIAQGFPRLGDPGGTGTNNNPDPRFGGLLSRTAYIDYAVTGSTADVADPAPTISAIIKGEVSLPVSGAFSAKGFSDNPAYIARLILTDPDMLNVDPRLIDDAEIIKTANYCDEILRDDTNAELLLLTPEDAAALAAETFTRYNSSGVLNTRYYRYQYDSGQPDPWTTWRDDPTVYEIPDLPTTIAPVTVYRKRYTFNGPLTDKVKAVDFFFNTVLPSFRGYMLIGPDGKLKIRTERPNDSSFIRSDAAIGATSISVNDIEPWLTSTQGLILIGSNLVTSETRTVTGASYSAAGNSIPLVASASGGMGLTASGGTLSGASGSTPASGTFTVSGTPGASRQIVATIDGVPVAYTLNADDNLQSSAGMLMAAINATWSLKPYIRATWSGTVVTVYAKLGNLTVPALTNAHSALLPSPTSAPVAVAASGGNLAAGVYGLAYSYTTATGETFVGPTLNVNLAANQKINVSSVTIPSGVDSLNWYLSKAHDDPALAFLVNNAGPAFTINVLPEPDAKAVPLSNSAGQETLRVMASFTQENILDGKFTWPMTGRESSINQVLIKYREASAGFANRELYVNDYAHQRSIGKINKTEISGIGIDNYNQASRIANSRLSKEREGDFFCEWSTDEAGLMFEEGDVVCVSDVSGGFVNLPVRIESLTFHDDLTTTFRARIYSTIMYSDQTGQHPIVLPSTLKYLNAAPPDATNVTVVEGHFITANDTWISTILGNFDFGLFVAGQLARIYVKYETDVDYHVVDSVIPDPDNHGVFELIGAPLTTGAGHLVKIVTESRFGFTNGLAAATAYPVFIVGPPPLEAPFPFVGYFDFVDGDCLEEWNGTPISTTLTREFYELQQLADDGITILRTQLIDPQLTSNLPDAIIWKVVSDTSRQEERATAVGAITGSGNATVVVTAAGMTGSPKTLNVPVLVGDSATVVDQKIVAALRLDADVSAFFEFNDPVAALIIVTAKVAAANDLTMNISIANGTCTGLTAAPTSTNWREGQYPSVLTMLPDGGLDFNPNQTLATNIVVLEGQTTASVGDGLLMEFQVPSDGRAAPLLVALHPIDEDYISLDWRFAWECATEVLETPHLPFYMWPEAFDVDHRPFRRLLQAGDRMGIFLRPDGIAEYHLNFLGPTSRPIYTSGLAVKVDTPYKCTVLFSDGGSPNPTERSPGGLRKPCWVRVNPDFRYNAAMQRFDRGLDFTALLPDVIKARVRQKTPYTNGTDSDWTYGTFVRGLDVGFGYGGLAGYGYNYGFVYGAP